MRMIFSLLALVIVAGIVLLEQGAAARASAASK